MRETRQGVIKNNGRYNHIVLSTGYLYMCHVILVVILVCKFYHYNGSKVCM